MTMIAAEPVQMSKITKSNFSELADAARMYKLMAQEIVNAAAAGVVTEDMMRAFALTSSNLDNVLGRAPSRVSVDIRIDGV